MSRLTTLVRSPGLTARLPYGSVAVIALGLAVCLPRPAAAQGLPNPGDIPAPPPAPKDRGEADKAEPAPEAKKDTGEADKAPPAPEAKDDDEEVDLSGSGSSEVIIIEGRAPTAGSVQVVKEKALERFEHDDVHKVLAAVPGVYVREEDGYGLRPNIGMRGSGSERSAKIALMEDGLLIAPAPYSAPAAYYFPMTTKMVGIEVFKGPAAIRFGPNTVGGAVNMLMRQVPKERVAAVDVAGGTDLYGKAYMYYGDRTEHTGWLFEVAKVRSDGFKKADGGTPTGFDINDFGARFQVQTGPRAVSHSLQLHVGFSNQLAHETYTGISDADFAKDPYRRYASSALDLLRWDHNQVRLRHELSSSSFRVTTTAYRHYFHRDWTKLNGFASGDSLRNVILFPFGVNEIYHKILVGERNSADRSETLMVGSNERWFEGMGVQSIANLSRSWLGLQHEIELGTRLHFDEAKRLHTEDGYLMRDLMMVPDGMPTQLELDAVDSTTAWASYYDHKATYKDLTVNAGVRVEVVGTDHFQRLHEEAENGVVPEINKNNIYNVLIPGSGAVYRPLPGLELLAGVHSGFVPVDPASVGIIRPERSVNYEGGARFVSPMLNMETIGFFSAYSNLNSPCRFSTGCSPTQVESQSSAGRVHAYGGEFLATAQVPLTRAINMPIQVTYTYQKTTFEERFVSSNPQWGAVYPGFEMPYIPNHQVSWEAALEGRYWHVATSGRYQSKMRDVAGVGSDPGQTGEALVFNAAGSYGGRWGKLYLTVENLFDEVHITSRRPLGARPGVPRRIVLGYKNSF